LNDGRTQAMQDLRLFRVGVVIGELGGSGEPTAATSRTNSA
jgi:hypothetical protein